MVIVLRWVDTELHTHEEFIGFYEVPSIGASLLVAVVKDTFLRLNITLATTAPATWPEEGAE